MRRVLVVLALGATLTACAGVDHVGQEIPVPPAAKQAVKVSVAEQMKDPRSAEFRNWHAFESNHALIICGEVNAKNGFGGYTGFEHFIGHATADGHLATPTALANPGGGYGSADAFWADAYPGCY